MSNLNISVDEESEDSSNFKTSVFQPVHVDDGGHKCDARKSKWSRPILQTETLSLVTVHDGSYIQEDRNQIFDTIYGVICHAGNLGTLGSTGVTVLLSYVSASRMENNGGVFLRASHLVIRFAAANEWAARGYENVRDDIEDILTNLRQFLQKSSWTALSPYDRIQLLTKMVPDIVRLERKDSGLVDRALAEILDAAASAVVPLEQFAANVKRRSKVVDGLRNLWAICDGR